MRPHILGTEHQAEKEDRRRTGLLLAAGPLRGLAYIVVLPVFGVLSAFLLGTRKLVALSRAIFVPRGTELR